MLQKGFATLEVILMVMVIGILASIAVPRFTSVTTAANTAKIQSDLTTIDTAIAIYIMENGKPASNSTISITANLKPYLQDADNLKPPKGKAYLSDGNEYTIPTDATYVVKEVDSEWRATLGDKTAGQFTKKTTT